VLVAKFVHFTVYKLFITDVIINIIQGCSLGLEVSVSRPIFQRSQSRLGLGNLGGSRSRLGLKTKRLGLVSVSSRSRLGLVSVSKLKVSFTS